MALSWQAADPGRGCRGRACGALLSAAGLMVTVCPRAWSLAKSRRGLAFGVLEAGEVVGAEFVVGPSGDHDVPDDDDHGVGHQPSCEPRQAGTSWSPWSATCTPSSGQSKT